MRSSSATDPAVVLYRRSLDARSGAGQLLAAQWRGLVAAGTPTLLACERGALKFRLRTGVRARRRSLDETRVLQDRGALLVDHGLCLPSADLAFVHNLATEASRHLPGADLAATAAHERDYFAQLSPRAVVVANSRLVAAALERHFAVAPDRIAVLYPGYAAARFTPECAARLRGGARAQLRVAPNAPLVGLVTSGDFEKRGLDVFFDCAERLAVERPDARFVVVGSKRLPVALRRHELVERGVVQHRPKGAEPERWLAALDLFLYPARFEEYGLVLAEAQALGVPVLTTRLVGAAECLPECYAPWLLDGPEPALLAARALALLRDDALRAELAAAAAASIRSFDDTAYVRGTLRLVDAQKRRLK